MSDDKKPSTSTAAEEKKPGEKKDEKEEKKKEPEPTFEILSNPARILRQQLKVITLNEGSQYVPMKDISIGGIIMVRNLKPEEEELVEPVAGKLNSLKSLLALYCSMPQLLTLLLIFLFQHLVQKQKMKRNQSHQNHLNGMKIKCSLYLIRLCLLFK